MAAYGFDEGSGTTVTDASGNGNNGTVANTTWSTTGKYGGRLQFNGTNALVTMPDAASLHLTSGMTLEAWVNPSTVNANWRDVIYKGNDNFYLEATSTQRLAARRRPDRRRQLRRRVRHRHAHRQHLGVSRPRPMTGRRCGFYVNGTQVASTAHTGAITTSTNPLQIGGDSIYGQFFAGLIDEVRVYNVALTAAQIQTDQATPVNSTGRDTTPPSQPGTLTANAVSSSGEIDLSWGASTDNVGVTGYQIERCQGTELHHLRPDRDPHRHHLQRHRRSAPPRATATASARSTPPATSAPTPTPPPPQHPPPGNCSSRRGSTRSRPG